MPGVALRTLETENHQGLSTHGILHSRETDNIKHENQIYIRSEASKRYGEK